ncbi:MAG: hypothetical protein C5B52_16350 [Bacteroidetes bacterium]|nr:MAG: hypothetical protein C5B52_16350 [Bacteroidota bacterium]
MEMSTKTMQSIEKKEPIKSEQEPDACYSKQEEVGNLSLSLDTMKRRLMISGLVNRIRQTFQIQLGSTKVISIKKVYRNIYVGQLKKRSLEDFLDAIYLQFEFFDDRNTIYLPVFDRTFNDLRELPQIEKRAYYWQDLLSELRLIKDN